MNRSAPIEALHALLEREPEARLALAISGGSDSMALLAATVALRDRHPAAAEALVLQVDHGLRPDSSDEGRRVAEQAEGLGFPVLLLRIEEEAPASGSLEAWARRRRYALLARAMRREGRDLLLTAHHRDDQVETIAMKLMRGTGLLGLTGMPSQRELFDEPGLRLARPFLALERETLERFRLEAGLPIVEDSSNRFLGHRRNLLRHLAVGDAGLDGERLLALASAVERCRDRLSALAARIIGAAEPCSEEIDGQLAISILSPRIPDVLLQAVIAELAAGLGAEPPPASDAALRDLCEVGRRVELRRDLWVERDELRLRVLHAPQTTAFEEQVLDIEGSEVWVPGLGTLLASTDKPESIDANPRVQWIDREVIVGELRLRCPEPGESMRPFGMQGSKLISDLLREMGRPARLRWSLPLVADDEGALWIPGGRAAERCRVRTLEREAVRLELAD